ncbi:MAG: FCD domain-containing protein, partial [Dechloromonas sp.]
AKAEEKRIGSEVREEWEERNRIFHEVLIAACPSRWLKHFLSILYQQAERYRRLSLYLRPIPRDIHVEHEALLHAAINREAEKAAEILSEHIQLTFRSVQAIPAEQLNK